MPQISNSFATFNSNRVREQLANKIFNVSVMETPLLSLIGKEDVDGPFVEWLGDSYAAGVATNKVEAGNAFSPSATTATDRYSNRTQISEKTLSITGTQEWAEKAGGQSEVNYQIVKKKVELKKDMEASSLQNTTAIAAAAATPPQSRGLLGFIATNVDKDAAGVNPNPLTNTAPTDGATRAFTETLLKNVMATMFNTGAEMDNLYIFLPSTQRPVFDTFLASQTRFDKSEDKTLYATLEVYIGPFGRVKAVNARHMRQRETFIVNPDYVKLGIGRPIEAKKQAERGDALEYLINCEWTLLVKNEKACAAIRDLT